MFAKGDTGLIVKDLLSTFYFWAYSLLMIWALGSYFYAINSVETLINFPRYFNVYIATIFSFILLIPYSILQINIKYLFFIFRTSTILVCISFVSLIVAYVTSDFSNFNVFQNSHSDKPLIYKITGAWGNHEGSILLWVCMISIYGFFLFYIW